MSVSWTLPFDEKILPEDRSKSTTAQDYAKVHRKSVEDSREFWAGVAREMEWFRPWDRVLDDSEPPFYKWFVGGELNASYLCLDRHVKTWRKNKVALIWEGEPTADGRPTEVRTLTYYDLYREVNRLAHLLKHRYNIKRGDTVGVYLPMVPELPAVMLAAARIGAVFTVVFSGFSSDALAERLNDAGAKILFTADGVWRKGKVLDLKPIADRALEKAPAVRNVVVVRRVGGRTAMREGRDEFYDSALKEVPVNAFVEPERTKSEDPLYVLYTSGTTGKPKGQVHDIGGYLTLLHATMNWVFDVRDTDVYWCSADIGWVTGHSYIVFGPLMEGVTGVMYEGALDCPAPDRWASIIERYGVSVFYTSPTAIRGWMRNGEEWVRKHDTSTVRLMHSVGEPINPEAFRWLFKAVGREKVPFGSTWWMTETGGILISHLPGLHMVPMKPGTNGPPLPGIDADVLDEAGKAQEAGERGYLVIRKPWPGMPLTIYKDPKRYVDVYYGRFPGVFYAGDYAVKDEDGYFWILGRADEVIKVAGHRLGTYELESALIQHPAVAESAVVGVPDEVKGEVPVAFVILRQGYTPSEGLKKELNDITREKVGAVAAIREVLFVSKLPKTRSAKIMRRVVQAVAAGRSPGDVTTLEDEASVEEVRSAHEALQHEVRGGKSS
ncbi:MAG: acetate--CoA ligase [Nitrososphaerota archaeon]|nr:acetate--CoA ligase [Nitrososphaerota archaeon]MDG6939453.1 acetate--CoA ligase [Nitrososphaerota archaeon]